jgi:hypothetical protein
MIAGPTPRRNSGDVRHRIYMGSDRRRGNGVPQAGLAIGRRKEGTTCRSIDWITWC